MPWCCGWSPGTGCPGATTTGAGAPDRGCGGTRCPGRRSRCPPRCRSARRRRRRSARWPVPSRPRRGAMPGTETRPARTGCAGRAAPGFRSTTPPAAGCGRTTRWSSRSSGMPPWPRIAPARRRRWRRPGRGPCRHRDRPTPSSRWDSGRRTVRRPRSGRRGRRSRAATADARRCAWRRCPDARRRPHPQWPPRARRPVRARRHRTPDRRARPGSRAPSPGRAARRAPRPASHRYRGRRWRRPRRCCRTASAGSASAPPRAAAAAARTLPRNSFRCRAG